MWLRLITGVVLLALGYYVGKQVGRMESIREELERARADATDSGDENETGGSSQPTAE